MMNGRKERIAEIRMADWERQLKTRCGRSACIEKLHLNDIQTRNIHTA